MTTLKRWRIEIVNSDEEDARDILLEVVVVLLMIAIMSLAIF